MSEEGNKATIMVVDDTPANLKLLDSLLRPRGYRVLAFPRGDLALEAAAKHLPDLILLDVSMPVMDGFEVCRRLKADEALQGIPVVFISAWQDSADKTKAMSAGAVDYITKPFQFEEVYARVQVQLEIAGQRQELKTARRALSGMRPALAAIVRDLEAARSAALPPDAASRVEGALRGAAALLERTTLSGG